MIGVRLNGRLGNQLFQYALAFSVAKKYHTFYIIDNDYKVDHVKKYFKTNHFLNNRLSRQILKKRLIQKLPFIFQNDDEAADEVLPLIRNNRFYYGFFQSELFFQNISGRLQNFFQIKSVYKKQFASKYAHLFEQKKVLAIHYRLGDYLTWGSEKHGGYNLALPDTYYENALEKIEGLSDYTVLVVTDDTINIANKLQGIKNKIVLSDNEIIDFQVLMNADAIISSNSSFCWWAAYLNPKMPIVFAPRHWHGFKVNREMPSNIIPGKFTKVDVF